MCVVLITVITKGAGSYALYLQLFRLYNEHLLYKFPVNRQLKSTNWEFSWCPLALYLCSPLHARELSSPEAGNLYV